jgi:Fe-S cluster assembly protein SufD
VAPWDAFVELNNGMVSDAVVLQVPEGVVVDAPFVTCHWVDAESAAVFPRTFIEVGRHGSVVALDLVASNDVVAFVDPVFEVLVGEGAHADHLVVQRLGPRVWQTAYHSSVVAQEGSLRAFSVALGGDYARVRTDSLLAGAGGQTDLLALYFGDRSQMHDFRTLQDHEGPKSTSELVFKGAVLDEARSAYSGLIRVRPGAVGTKAFQTNRNLVLSDTGLASYSVPNLDIEENEVMCSHASATGPIDAEQRFYLESRGVPPAAAERLIVLGFFDDLLARLPVPSLRRLLWSAIAGKLDANHAGDASHASHAGDAGHAGDASDAGSAAVRT